MKRNWTLGLAAIAGLAIGPALALAGNSPAQDKSAEVRTVSGCLSQGDSADEFKLTGADGSTWEIRSKTVKLAAHVGHTVKVTGNVRTPDAHAAKEKVKDAVDSDAKEHGHLNATGVDMVSDSCKK